MCTSVVHVRTWMHFTLFRFDLPPNKELDQPISLFEMHLGLLQFERCARWLLFKPLWPMDAKDTRLQAGLYTSCAELSERNLPQKGQPYIVITVLLLSRCVRHRKDKQSRCNSHSSDRTAEHARARLYWKSFFVFIDALNGQLEGEVNSQPSQSEAWCNNGWSRVITANISPGRHLWHVYPWWHSSKANEKRALGRTFQTLHTFSSAWAGRGCRVVRFKPILQQDVGSISQFVWRLPEPILLFGRCTCQFFCKPLWLTYSHPFVDL